jgi:methylmalonyl-CoA mutase N-terminal domain/subunit
MTINAPAAIMLAFYVVAAERQGVPATHLGGTIQTDILKEYIAQKEWCFPVDPAMRLVTDMVQWCSEHMPRWHPISISGYHIREAGSTAAQELAFTLKDGLTYVEHAVARGLAVDEFAPRLSFFFVARTTLLEEVAKFRAARRMWARIMREEFGAADPRSQMLRFHTQTAGVQLTAQQPEVNVVRVTVQALAAVLGGTQSLHTNSFDEAIALPSQRAALLAVRTQQVLASETDLTATVDPFAGSYAIESMTNDIEDAATELMTTIEDMGGAVAAIERGFQKAEIERAAYDVTREIDSGERVVVGVNKFVSDSDEPYEQLAVNPAIEAEQAARLAEVRSRRDAADFSRRISEVKETAEGTGNLLYPLREALRAGATLGEVCDALRDVWGIYRPPDAY